MRVTTIAALALLPVFGVVTGALAREPVTVSCLPSTVVWPVYTEAGGYLGTVEAPVKPLPHLETSRFTDQPLPVVYNNPGSLPGSVDPYLHLVPLPHVKRSSTLGAYPVGY